MSKIKPTSKSIAFITKRRILYVTVSFGLFLVLLIYNLFNLQYIRYDYYKSKVYDQITTSSPLKAERGNIYDSNMNLLATNKTVWRIFVSSRGIKKAQKETSTDYIALISDGLSDILGTDKDKTKEKISNSNVLDITIKKSVEEDEYREVISFIDEHKLSTMVFAEAQTTRFYPEGTLAAHTLGFVGSDLQGLYGLEYYYNSTLSGKDGYYLYGKDANGNELPTQYATYVDAVAGNNIITTLDSYIQKQLESELETIRINHGVQNRVTGVVMNTATGAILGMATSTPYNPNSPYELDFISAQKLKDSGFPEGSEEYRAYKKELLEIMWSNKAVSETYEPGSTFKIVTVSAALDSKSAKATDKFSCHGYLSIGNWHIKCHKTQGHGSGFSLAYGLQMSCNPTMMTIADRMGAQTFYDYIERFGYFEKSGIDLPSEASTIFHKPENIGPTELATTSFGQRFKVSVIRHLTSICAVANEGKLITPYLVERVTDSEGVTVSRHETVERRQVISEDIAKTVSTILEEGVSGDGGAKNARVDGYKVAAKTGTSQKFDVLDSNGNSYLRIGSTVAFSMNDETNIAVIIVVDEPTSAVKYGSVVAAPYISSFLSDALPYLGCESSATEYRVQIPDLTKKATADAVAELKSAGISYEVVGQGEYVLSQTPHGYDVFTSPMSKVVLYTEERQKEYIVVPNLLGMEIEKANATATSAGLNIRIKSTATRGGATVISQSLTAGTVVPRESIIDLEILYLDFED